MANSLVNVVSAPAPAITSAGAGGASKEGTSFKDLLAGAEASAPRPQDAATPEEGALPAETSGEESPPDGNPLPLAAPLLPPAEIVAVPAAPTTVEATLQTAAASTAPPTSGVTGSPPLPAVENTATPSAERVASATPVTPPVTNKAGQAAQTLEQAAAAVVAPRAAEEADIADTPADSEERPSTVASLVSQLSEGDESVDDAAMRRLLASLSGSTPTQASTPQSQPVVPTQVTPAKQDLPPPVTPLAASAAAAAAPQVPATNADRLLRELKFDRLPDVATQAPVSTPHAPTNLQPQVATPASTSTTPVMQLQTPMQNSAEWADGLGERVLVMANGHQQNASIRLNPAHLGPIEVQVSMAGDQTHVTFTAHHGATREALEAATPRLREMLGSQGFTNVNVNISHQSPGDRPTQGQPQPELWSSFDGRAETDTDGAVGFTPTPSAASRSRLDTYA